MGFTSETTVGEKERLVAELVSAKEHVEPVIIIIK